MINPTERFVCACRRVPLFSFGGIVAAARHLAALGRRRAERTVVVRYAGWGWCDFTERALNDDLTGQPNRPFLP